MKAEKQKSIEAEEQKSREVENRLDSIEKRTKKGTCRETKKKDKQPSIHSSNKDHTDEVL